MFPGEWPVREEEYPLVLALMATQHIQFVLKVYQEGEDPALLEEPVTLNQPNSFFAAMKKKLNKVKSKDKVNHALV